MKVLIIISLLFFNILSAKNLTKSKEEKNMLESISNYSINIGTGTSKVVYVFVDPMCKYSRKIITKILENKTLHVENTFHIFLYRLEKFESDKLIAYIFQAQDQLSTLEEVMVYMDMPDKDELNKFQIKTKTIEAINKIAEVGKSLKMKRRPYIISFEKDSKYCRVSEGEASCLEDF